MQVFVDQHRQLANGLEIGYWQDGSRVVNIIPHDHQPQPINGEMFEIVEIVEPVREVVAALPPKTVGQEEKPKTLLPSTVSKSPETIL